MSPNRLHLDTTVQLSRIVYSAEETLAFDAELAGVEEVSTTSLVYREFLRTIISDIEYLHTNTDELIAADSRGFISLGRLSQLLGAARNRYSQRSIRRLHLVIGALTNQFARTRVRKNRVLRKLERMAQAYCRAFFVYTDRTGSAKEVIFLQGLEPPGHLPEESRRSSGRSTLRHAARPFPPRPLFPEGAATFLEARESQVTKVEQEMSAAPSKGGRDDKLLKFLQRLKANDGSFDFTGRLPKYRQKCWYLGDLLIAMECPDGAAVYSTDRAFPILCKALGLAHHMGYRSPAPLGSSESSAT
ncbi:MAG: hypothetical protein AAGM22_00015 [Acidobacteriota bacterium]